MSVCALCIGTTATHLKCPVCPNRHRVRLYAAVKATRSNRSQLLGACASIAHLCSRCRHTGRSWLGQEGTPTTTTTTYLECMLPLPPFLDAVTAQLPHDASVSRSQLQTELPTVDAAHRIWHVHRPVATQQHLALGLAQVTFVLLLLTVWEASKRTAWLSEPCVR